MRSDRTFSNHAPQEGQRGLVAARADAHGVKFPHSCKLIASAAVALET